MNNFNNQNTTAQVAQPELLMAKLFNVRLHYLSVITPAEPQQIVGQAQTKTPKYEASILIPKDNQEALNTVYNTYKAAAEKAGFPVASPGHSACPLKDGDNYEKQDGSTTQPHPGYWFVRTSSQFRPQLVSIYGGNVLADSKTVMNPGLEGQIASAFYNGVDAHVILTPYVYDASAQNGRKGVAFNPAVLVSKHTGDALATGVQFDAQEEFAGMFKESGDFDFGATESNIQQNQTNNAFGGAQQQATNFGQTTPQAQPAQQQAQGGNMFGAQPTQEQPAQQGTAPQGGNMFGGNNNNNGGNMFGGNNNNNGGNMF